MDQELGRIVKAVEIASDPAQKGLHAEAVQYLASTQAHAAETWRIALTLFVDQTADGTNCRTYSTQTRFFALRVLDEFLDNRSGLLSDPDVQVLKTTFLHYIQSEYLQGSAETAAPFLRNKFSHTLTLLFLRTYINQWTTFFTDIFSLISPPESSSSSQQPAFNRHVSLLFFHLVIEISGEVADQIIKSARSFSEERHAQDMLIRDLVRERDAARVNEAVLTIISESVSKMEMARKEDHSVADLSSLEEVIDWGVRTFGSYAGWIDINLTVTPTTVPLLFLLLSHYSLPIRLATCTALLRIVAKGLKEPEDKVALYKVLSLGEVIDALETKTRQQQMERKDDPDENEELYREALGRLMNILGLELIKLTEESPEKTAADVVQESNQLLQQILPTVLRFLSDPYDDTASTVFPMLQALLLKYKRAQRTNPVPVDSNKRAFLASLLQAALQKLRYDEDTDTEDLDEDDQSAFETIRKDLRTFMDATLVLDHEIVINAVQGLALDTFSAYQAGVAVKWPDAELAIFLVFIYGEIDKSGAKGRAAFCDVSGIPKGSKQPIDYSVCPLSTHGNLMLALIQSGISGYPNRLVVTQFYETVARYGDFFKVRKECVLPVLEVFMGNRGIQNQNPEIQKRVYYLFYRFIKDARNSITPDVVVKVIDLLRPRLNITVEIPEPEPGTTPTNDQTELLALIINNPGGIFDSQMYLIESVGTMLAVRHPSGGLDTALLLSVVQPLLADLAVSYQASTNGTADAMTVARVHHIIMALGSMARGFPDWPRPPPPDWTAPPLDVFNEIAEAILLCLREMKGFKVVRDASRSAFARIIATTGPNVTKYVPALMGNLLVHFDPSELADFTNFIGLLIHQLQHDIFDVLDVLIGPLGAHITQLLSQPITGTDDRVTHNDVKKAYLLLLNNIIASKIHGVLNSPRNTPGFEPLLENMQSLAEDVTNPPAQKAALVFLGRAVGLWGILKEKDRDNTSLPGFEQFIYKRLVPLSFRVAFAPSLNIKDGQTISVLHEVANFLQMISGTRESECIDFLNNIYLPSQVWPSETASDFTKNLSELDAKSFRKYFMDIVRQARSLKQS